MARVSLLVIVLAVSAAKPADAQWTVGAYIGWAAPFKTDVRIHSPANNTDVLFSNVHFQTRSFQTPLYYGLRVGRMMGRRIGGEIELTHLKIFADVDSPVGANGTTNGTKVSGPVVPRSFFEQLNVSHGLNLLLGNVVTRFPIRKRKDRPASIILTPRFGVGSTLSHVEASVLGTTTEHYEPGGVALQAAGGLELPIHEGWHIVGEYKLTYTRQHLGVGSAAVELSPLTQHVVTGIAYRF